MYMLYVGTWMFEGMCFLECVASLLSEMLNHIDSSSVLLLQTLIPISVQMPHRKRSLTETNDFSIG